MSENQPVNNFDTNPEPANQSEAQQKIAALIDRIAPTMIESWRKDNQRLYQIFQHAFHNLHIDPAIHRNGTLVELGIGTAVYLPAVQTMFAPQRHIGIDRYQGAYYNSFKVLKEMYGSPQTTGLEIIQADAQNPYSIPNFEPQPLKTIIALHPDTRKASDEIEPTSITDPGNLNMLDNWRKLLTPDGLMFVTGYFSNYVEPVVDNKHLHPYVYLYGITGVYIGMQSNAYLAVLKGTPRPESVPPIIWKREDYPEFKPAKIPAYNPNMYTTQTE